MGDDGSFQQFKRSVGFSLAHKWNAVLYFLCLAGMDQLRTQIHLTKDTMTYEDISLIKKLIPEANAVAALASSLNFQAHYGRYQIKDNVSFKYLRLIQLSCK